MKLHPKYIIDSEGNRTSVILPIEEFNNLIGLKEDLEDVNLYDEAKKYPQDFRTAEEVFSELDDRKKAK